MRKTTAQKVEELHAALPEQFKDFVRRIAAIPKLQMKTKTRIQGEDSKGN